MTYWLLKSEPQTYSVDRLAQEGETLWDGVRNYQARNFLQQMRPGDLSFFYHSNAKPPGIVGLARVLETGVIDPTQFDPQSDYFDPKASLEKPRWQTVKVAFEAKFPEIITLDSLRRRFSSEEFILLKKGNRLSVLPVPENVAGAILAETMNNGCEPAKANF
ncbi:MAG: EVE domain-containing protein [Cyanobacteria bacterium RI_101]|nr:EVE domain-containing protein [Cyanobacteria bacterium RI_101]